MKHKNEIKERLQYKGTKERKTFDRSKKKQIKKVVYNDNQMAI